MDRARRRFSHYAIASLIGVLLAACGGGGGNDDDASGPPAPTGLSYQSPNVFVVGQAITSLSPTVTGTVTQFTIAPALPAGLVLDGNTGVVSGTPTAVAAASTHTVTASNGGGQTTATLSIAVNDIAPVLAAASGSLTFTTGVPVHVTPVANSGGASQAWAIDPALPAGLTFDSADGSIDGTPTALATSTSHLVSAQNTGGRDEISVTIEVESGVLLDLGHAELITAVRVDGARVLSRDAQHWVLWNSATAELVASGDAAPFCPDVVSCSRDHVALAGPSFVIRTASGLDVRAADDGDLAGAITGEIVSWALAAGGGYVVTTSRTGLTAWSTDGTVLFERAGDYSDASVFAAAGEIRVGNGPAAANAVEKISVPGGTSSLTPAFTGEFHSWFVDGERFLTNVANTVWTYSHAAVQQDLKALPTIEGLAGQGNWIWTHEDGGPNRLSIYAVGGSATPQATYALAVLTEVTASGGTIGILWYGEKSVSVVDLSGAGPVRTDFTTTHAYAASYAASSSARWWVGTGNGVLYERVVAPDTERVLALGRARSIAGSPQRVAVATASGRVFYFDADDGALEGTIDFPSSNVLLSTDGSVLAVAGNRNEAQYHTDWTVKVLSLPAENEINSWPYTYPSYPVPFDISLSGSGTVLGQVLGTFSGTWQYTRPVTTVPGSPIYSDSLTGSSGDWQPIRLSPDGSLIAVSSGPPSSDTGTNIVRNGMLVSAVPGWAVSWLDDDRLLVNHYQSDAGELDFLGSSIYDSSGNELSEPPLPDLRQLQPVTSDSIYSPQRNSILSISTGATLFSSPNPSTGVGAVAGERVVFASGSQVRTEAF